MKKMHAIGFAVLAGSFHVHAQDGLPAVLRSLAEQTAAYQRLIPNFTCNEVATVTLKKENKVLKRIEFQADIHVQRKEDKSLDEKFSITSYMGKPTPNGGKFDLPIYLEGGLSQGVPSFFNEKYQHCYDYHLDGRRIDFHTRPDRDAAACREKVDTTGFSLVDAEAKLLKGEIRRPEKEADREREVPNARIDYADVRLDDRVFRMPTHVYGEMNRSGLVGTFEAYYTSCKLFTAKTTIRPGDGAAEIPAP